MAGKFRVLLVYPNLMMVNLVPTSLSIIAACLKKNGIDVRLFDTTHYRTENESVDDIRIKHMQVRSFDLKACGIDYKKTDVFEDFVKTVDNYQPNLIGVTVVEDTYLLAINLIKKIRHRNIPVVFGGVLPTFSPEEIISNENVDILCIGEGEEALVELCNTLNQNGNITRIKNLWVKQNGKIYKNPLRKLVQLDKLPFEDFSIFEDKRFYRPMQGKIYRMIPIAIDRGCPYECSFCASPTTNKLYREKKLGCYFRQKSNDRVIEEIKYLTKKYSIEYIYFNTDTFLVQSEYNLMEFAKKYKEIGLPFWCQSRVETINDIKIKILKDMNLDRMSIGIEHGNEEFRKKYLKKNFTNDQAIKAFKILAKNKVKVTVNNIIGFPDETKDLVFDTINLNRQLESDSVNAYVFVPYKGTFLREYCIKKGYLRPDAQTDSLMRDPILEMPQLSKIEIKGLVRTFPLYVKMPQECFDKIIIAEQLTSEGDKALAELREIYFKKYFS